ARRPATACFTLSATRTWDAPRDGKTAIDAELSFFVATVCHPLPTRRCSWTTAPWSDRPAVTEVQTRPFGSSRATMVGRTPTVTPLLDVACQRALYVVCTTGFAE